MKKKQVCRMSLSSVLVLLLLLLPIRSSTIGSAGLHPAPSAGSFASSLDDCTPPEGVTIQAPYSSSYTACALGSFGLEGPTGAISFREGYYYDFLVAKDAETPGAVIYWLSADRDDSDHIIGFHGGEPGPAAPFASVGMAYGPENVLFYSRRPNNELGEVKAWSQQTDRVIALSPRGVSQAVSGINFVPGGFPHAGELKLVTYENSDWYEAILSPEADGTYSIATITQKTTISPHPGSFVYVPPASPEFFDYQALLIAEDNNATISAYTLDSESNPVPASRTPFSDRAA